MVQLRSPQMRKYIPALFVLSIVFLAGCSSSNPLTEAQQAQQYGMTVEMYREEKQAAARMNMNFDDHIKMLKMEEKLK
jgi:uncharacterized protein YceK